MLWNSHKPVQYAFSNRYCYTADRTGKTTCLNSSQCWGIRKKNKGWCWFLCSWMTCSRSQTFKGNASFSLAWIKTTRYWNTKSNRQPNNVYTVEYVNRRHWTHPQRNESILFNKFLLTYMNSWRTSFYTERNWISVGVDVAIKYNIYIHRQKQ